MDKSEIKAAARKALMAAAPDYYSWPPEQQEKFRANMDEIAQNKVERILLNSLLDLKSTTQNASEIWSDLPISKLNNLNWAKLLTAGIGENFIFLNENMAENTSLLDFISLYDYDYNDHLFQEQANKKEFKNYQTRDYYAFRFSPWARLIINEQLYYANLYSLAGYLIDEIEDIANDTIENLIPHKYVEGKENGKQTKGGILWDMKIDAAGQEKQLDELNSRWYAYKQDRWIALSKEFINSSPAVFTTEKNWDEDPSQLFIFNNAEALKQVRWRYFLADCELLKADFLVVEKLEEREAIKVKLFLQENCRDIMENFDPKVVKLKKKMKIVMTPEALYDLSKDDDLIE